MIHVVYFVSGNPEYLGYLNFSISTVRKVMPDAEIHLYTDIDTTIDGVTINYAPGGYSRPLMIKNTEVWRDFCASHEGIAVFLDPDVLMAMSLNTDDLALGDIAVTWRDNMGGFSRNMPYNTGVVIARCGQASAQFFDEMVQLIEAMEPDHQKWYGNQLALAELVGPIPLSVIDHWKHDRVVDFAPLDREAMVQLLPCDRYNWTPEGDEPLMDQVFVHLKGLRKHRMEPIAKQILSR